MSGRVRVSRTVSKLPRGGIMVLSFPLAFPNHAIATSMKRLYMGVIRNRKSVPGRSKTDSKSVELATVPRVRIPDSPPESMTYASPNQRGVFIWGNRGALGAKNGVGALPQRGVIFPHGIHRKTGRSLAGSNPQKGLSHNLSDVRYQGRSAAMGFRGRG